MTNTRPGDLRPDNYRLLDEVAGRFREGFFGAGEVLARAAKRSAEDAKDARRNLRSKDARSDPLGLALFANLADEARSQTFLGAWAVLAAGERLGRPVFGGGLPPGLSALAGAPLAGALSPRTLALGTAALDLYSGYAALRERERWLPGLVGREEMELQHRRGAGRALDTARALGGTLIKAGQFASTRPDLLPPAYTDALSTLQDRVPPRSFATIRGAVERETGRPLGETFAHFEREPVAAASIAQVHRARLKDGRTVAVKVRYPEVADLVREDLDSLEYIFDALSRLEPDVQLRPIADYLRWTLPLELDLAREARAMERLRRALADREDVVVPRSVEGLASEGLVVMEYLEGVKVNDREALVAAGMDPAKVAELLNDAFADQLFRRGILHADPHPGNLLVQPGPRLVLLDHGLTLSLERGFVDVLDRMVTALTSGDLAALTSALGEAGLPVDADTDLEVLLRLVGVVLGNPEEAEGSDDASAAPGALAGKLGAAVRDLPPRLLLVGRAIGLLDGTTRRLDEDLDALRIVSRYTRSAPKS